MPEQEPLVSIVLAVWNGELYLAEAIESLLSQTYPHFELILVDDGSDDRTRRIIEEYAERDARIRPLYLPHQGLVPSLNAGCALARGKYIARMDGDDIAIPTRLERQVQFLESRPRVALLGAAVEYITANGHRTSVIFRGPAEGATIKHRLRQANCFCHSVVMMRTDAFHRVGGYRRAWTEAQDYDLWMRLADHHELANLSTVLLLYRVHSRQVSLNLLERQALLALGARVAAETRRRTGADPLDGVDRVDRTTLRELGLRDDEIDAHLLNAYLTCLSAMPRLGFGKAALAAIRDVVTQHSLLGELDVLSDEGEPAAAEEDLPEAEGARVG